MKHTIQQELHGVIAFVAVIWGVFILDCLLPFDIHKLGLTPRTLVGLVGICSVPLEAGSLPMF